MPVNPHLARVPPSCFRQLDALLDPLSPAPGRRVLDLSVGDPEHGVPDFVTRTILANQDGFGHYAPITGTAAFRESVCGFLTRRYALPEGMLDPEHHVLPVAGLREGMFLIALAVLPDAGAAAQRPAIAIPNPFYHSYIGAAVALGADPILLPATRETGFLPDLDRLDEATLSRLAAFYLCSPANPQGAVAGPDYLRRLIGLARRHDFALLVDECYADIYFGAPPVGVLEGCAALGGDLDKVVTFHSVSKRSNAPGLRSGFAAGDADLMLRFRALRDVGGTAMPLPIQAASAALWNDDAHAAESRALYVPKFEAAERILGNRGGFYRPEAGMFLWLEVEDCVAATRRLWTEAGVKVMPGRYMSTPDADGANPGAGYLRIALVPDLESTVEALERIAETLA